MHYVRKIEQDKRDIRSRTYFVYTCNICKKEEWIMWRANFDTSAFIKCPKCGIVDDTNNYEYLTKRKHELEQQIQTLKDELEEVSKKVSCFDMCQETKEN